MNKKGFTLLELLVVVLIIGILSAVALPRYQKAVEKSRVTQAITLLKAVYDAQKVYYMANGSYATSFDELGIEIPWAGNTSLWPYPQFVKDTRSNNDWSFQLYQNEDDFQLNMVRLSGKYRGAGFFINVAPAVSPTYGQAGQTICLEYPLAGFTGEVGSYCQKVIKGTLIRDWGGNEPKVYRMP